MDSNKTTALFGLDYIPIVETFTSLEGESIDSGTTTFFIRTAVCQNKCSFCDTKESWAQNDKNKIWTKGDINNECKV